MFGFGPVYALQVLPDILQSEPAGEPDIAGPITLAHASGEALLTMFTADLFGLLVSIVCLGGLSLAAAQALDGRQPSLLDAVNAGLRRFLPMLGACTYAGLAILAGFILLVVPGFILTAWFFVVVPVCALEGADPRESLRRSAALSKGQRWPIFALFLVIACAGVAATACTCAAQRVVGGIIAAAVEVLLATAVGIFAGTIPVVTYRALAPTRHS